MRCNSKTALRRLGRHFGECVGILQILALDWWRARRHKSTRLHRTHCLGRAEQSPILQQTVYGRSVVPSEQYQDQYSRPRRPVNSLFRRRFPTRASVSLHSVRRNRTLGAWCVRALPLLARRKQGSLWISSPPVPPRTPGCNIVQPQRFVPFAPECQSRTESGSQPMGLSRWSELQSTGEWRFVPRETSTPRISEERRWG